MAKICLADREKGQSCKNCIWHQKNEDKSYMYGEPVFCCCAKPNEYGYVDWEGVK